MQDNYFKFCQTSFKDVYSLTLRKSLYLWLFPELVATMNHASGKKLLVELVPTNPKYFPVLFPVCTHKNMGNTFCSRHQIKPAVFSNQMCTREIQNGGQSLISIVFYFVCVSKMKTRFTTVDPCAVITELFHSLVCQMFLALRQKCKRFYSNKHCIGEAAHSQHLLFLNTVVSMVALLHKPSGFLICLTNEESFLTGLSEGKSWSLLLF